MEQKIENELLEKHKHKIDNLYIIDDEKIIARDVDNGNHTVYIVEDKTGKRNVRLYNEIDQTKIPPKKEDISITIAKKTETGEEKIKLQNYNDKGNYIEVDFELERDKFLHPKKFKDILPDQPILPV